jgi:hypothetical protein
MSFKPTPKQALFLWKMLCSEDPEDREPSLTAAGKRLKAKTERKPLIDGGFLTTEKRGRSTYLIATPRAFAWAATCDDVTLMRSNSADGAAALEGLLRRLLPMLRRHGLSMAEVLRPGAQQAEAPAPNPGTSSIEDRVAAHARSLSAGAVSGLVPLSELRDVVDAPWSDVAAAVLRLHDAGRLELHREDNRPAITPALEAATIHVGPEPRHLLRWRG